MALGLRQLSALAHLLQIPIVTPHELAVVEADVVPLIDASLGRIRKWIEDSAVLAVFQVILSD